MASVEKRGDKFSMRWLSLRGESRRRACPTAAAAKELKRDVEHALAVGRDWEPQPEGVREVADLEEVSREFLAHRKLRLRARTLHRYGENLDLFRRFLRTKQPRGVLATELLSRPLLEEFHAWLLRPENGLHGRARSADTARKIAEVTQLFWEWAEQSERWDGLIPSPKRIEMTRSEADLVVAPTWSEMDACVLACRGWHQELALLLRYTGLRVGEAMALLWSDVDMSGGTLTLRREIIKSGPTRTVPLSPHLVEALSGWGARTGFLVPSGRLKGDRERLARARDLARAWQRAGVRDVVWKGRPFHSFRKGFKSGLLAAGGMPDAIDHLQGHALGHGSSRGRYIDPSLLGLEKVVQLIPPIATPSKNVVSLEAGARA